jgi:hypothetical protein
MSQPLRFVDRNLEKLRAGFRAFTSTASELMSRVRSRPTWPKASAYAAEVFRQVLHRVLAVTIESGVNVLIQTVFAPRRLTVVHPCPSPRSAS